MPPMSRSPLAPRYELPLKAITRMTFALREAGLLFGVIVSLPLGFDRKSFDIAFERLGRSL